MIQRKSVPYFQSIEDINSTTLKNRNNLIMAEVLKNKGGEEYLQSLKRFHNKVVFAPNYEFSSWAGAGLGRYSESMSDHVMGNYIQGFRNQNA